MRNPNYLNKVTDKDIPAENIIKLDSIPDFDIPDYDLNDDRDFNKYIIEIKKTVRNSYEYRRMVSYLKDTVDMNRCSFYQNVTNIDTSKIKIHIHHEPFDLETICRIVYRKRNAYRESTEVESVAKEVMFLHYNMMVGLIPLAETVHELVHNKFLFVPIDRVYGVYQRFADAYWDFMDESEQTTFNALCEATKAYTEDQEQENMKLLRKDYLFIDFTGAWDIPKYEDVLKSIRSRIDEIRKEKDQS